MSINLTIMRPEPITQQEFYALVPNDPELDFSSLENRIQGVFHAYHLVLNQGRIDVVSGVEVEELPIGKLMEIAERLNARLFEDFDGTFFRKDGENFQDHNYYEKCCGQRLLIRDASIPQTSRNKHPLRDTVIGILLTLSLGAFIYYCIVNGVYTFAVFGILAFSFLITYFMTKQERIYKKREKQSDLMQIKINNQLQAFFDRFSEIVGREKVLLIMANGARKRPSPELQAIDEALKNTSVVEKKLSGDESIVPSKRIVEINAEIQKNRNCRIILFYNTFSWKNMVAELESLEIIRNSPEIPPRIVILQTVYEMGQMPVPVDLTGLAEKKKITIALCMFINRTNGKNGEWLIHDLATFNREYTAHGFNEAILWADAYSKGTGFKPLPLNLIITTLESWPSRLNAAGIQTTVRVEDFDECCVRSIDSGCCFTGLNLTVEFDGYPVCLLCFIKVPFLNSRKINVCFYCENEKLLEALKHAGLDKEK